MKSPHTLGSFAVATVTPHAGVWIEIKRMASCAEACSSPPTRGCGLKSDTQRPAHWWDQVTPHAGVWIEICRFVEWRIARGVTPHAGVWIEILITRNCSVITGVTPHAGVWIEIRQCV